MQDHTPDPLLIREALQGDRNALALLVERHFRPAFGMAWALTGSREESEEVVQEAFLRACRGLSGLRGGSFGPWLAGIVRRVAADFRRERNRRGRATEHLWDERRASGESATPRDPLEREEEERLLQEEIAALPENLRLPLVLYYFEAESSDRVAFRLGIKPATARKRLQAARDRIRERLLARFEGALRRLAPAPRAKSSLLAALAALPWGKGEAARAGELGESLRAGSARPEAAVPLLTLGALMAISKGKVSLVLFVLALVLGALWLGTSPPEPEKPARAPVLLGRAPLAPAPLPETEAATRPLPAAVTARPATPLHGVVLDRRSGEPVPDAEVTIHAHASSEERLPSGEPITSTDSEGRFRVAALPAGRYTIAAGHRGHFSERLEVEAPAAEPVEILLKRATFASGRVFLRDREHPLVRGEIGIYRNHLDGNGSFGDQVKTGPDGECDSGPLNSGEHWFTFLHQGFRPITHRLHLTEAQPADALEIIFVEGLSRRGRVLGRGGRPLPLARLGWHRERAPFASRVECAADAEGKYEVRGLEAGLYRVNMSHLRHRSDPGVAVSVEEGPLEEVDLFFDVPEPLVIPVEHPASQPVAGVERLKGQVLDEKGDPLAAVEVSAAGGQRLLVQSRTDRDGRFELALEPGEYRIEAEDRRRGVASVEGVKVEGESSHDPVVLRLEAAGTIRGRIIAPRGLIVVDLSVRAVRTETAAGNPGGGHPHGRPFLHGSPDAEGWFLIRAEEGAYLIEILEENYLLGKSAEAVRPGDPPMEIVIEDRPRRRIAGKVVMDGAPMEGAGVWRCRPGDKRVGQWPEAVTDGEGAFELPLRDEGSIVIVARGARFTHAVSEPLEPPAEGSLEGVLVTAMAGEDFQVQVKEEDGRPAAGASLRLEGVDNPWIRAAGTADPMGSWIVPRLPPGQYRLRDGRAHGARAAKRTVRWEPGAGPVEMILPPE